MKIIGRIFDEDDGSPLAGADIYLKYIVNGEWVEKAAVSNLSGDFIFLLDEKLSSYRLTGTYVGYRDTAFTDSRDSTTKNSVVDIPMKAMP